MPPLFAQVQASVDPVSAAAGGLATNPLAYICAVLLAVVAFLYRQQVARETAQAAALEALRKQQIEDARSDQKEQRELLMQVVPLSSKLVEAVELLEKITDRVGS